VRTFLLKNARRKRRPEDDLSSISGSGGAGGKESVIPTGLALGSRRSEGGFPTSEKKPPKKKKKRTSIGNRMEGMWGGVQKSSPGRLS